MIGTYFFSKTFRPSGQKWAKISVRFCTFYLVCKCHLGPPDSGCNPPKLGAQDSFRPKITLKSVLEWWERSKIRLILSSLTKGNAAWLKNTLRFLHHMGRPRPTRGGSPKCHVGLAQNPPKLGAQDRFRPKIIQKSDLDGFEDLKK